MAETETKTPPAATPQAASPWSPFQYATFSVLWTATVVANIGTWMYNAAAGWLITTLTPDPLVVSLVQVATSVPMFLFALPAGALADILDKRRLLLTVVIASMCVSTAIAALVSADLVSPPVLLFFTFLLGPPRR
jgi:MFS family permease